MKWFLIIVGIFILAVLAVLVFGLLQSAKHSVTRSVHLKQKPETVFAVLDNWTDMPKWSSSVSKVETKSGLDTKRIARFTLKWGGRQMIFTQLERIPPRRLVISMAKEGGEVMGMWTYDIAAETDGSRVSLTESGELGNPFYRTIARIRGLDTNIRQTLGDLAKKFDETVEVR
ncbi:MAG: SRPBCC family protein [Verrucomicrobiota bacterium]|jgi:ribosome-associated toxin RatA of RatAB toxin-antitoxin module